MGWLTYNSGAMRSSIGLRSVEMCRADECTYRPLEQFERDVGWIRTGVAAYTAALLTGGIVLALALTAALRRRQNLLAKTALVAAGSAAVTGMLFIAASPQYSGMQFDYSVFMYFVGSVLSVAVGITSIIGARRPPG